MTREMAARLTTELDAYEALLSAMSKLRKGDDSAWLYELVRRRRDLATQIPKVREAGMEAFSCRPELLNEFRSRLSQLQNVVLLLQADWPAVSIDERLYDYANAAKTVAQANRAFIEWVRGAIPKAK
jgi:hypothetical protein